MCDGGDRDRRVLYFSIFIIKEREERERERSRGRSFRRKEKDRLDFQTIAVTDSDRWRIIYDGQLAVNAAV